MTNIKTLTRSSTLILSLATICMAISAQIAPAHTPASVGFADPAALMATTGSH